MTIKDMKQAVRLLDEEWNLGKKEAGTTSNICAWIYLMEILEETEQVVYYKEKGKLLGFASYSNKNSKKHLLKKKIYTFIKNRLYKSKKIKDIDALHQYENNYDYMPSNLKDKYDGEVSMLILDKSLRGKGIGKKMLKEVFDLAKKDNVKNLYIYTDDSCNYHIYESLGCKKVYETTVTNKEKDIIGKTTKEQAYVYEMVL
jgi:GNAT superfamily N-acetyltransferase